MINVYSLYDKRIKEGRLKIQFQGPAMRTYFVREGGLNERTSTYPEGGGLLEPAGAVGGPFPPLVS
eukprot:963798-Amorphochlora_amoeboformis.AAC.1